MPESKRTFEPPFTDVPGAIADIRAGRMVIVVDDEDRDENRTGALLYQVACREFAHFAGADEKHRPALQRSEDFTGELHRDGCD